MAVTKYPSADPTRKAWQGMINRCYTTTNKDYPAVGGKGIKTCESWKDYKNFLADMGEKPDDTIFTRYNLQGDFCKENCYWQPKVFSRTNSLYSIWKGVKRRCGETRKREVSEYSKEYGERGVTMDKDWADSFASFAQGVGARPTEDHQLDRIDNDLGYFAGNVRWVLPKENANNRSDNIYIEISGQRKTLQQWAEYHGIHPGTLWARFNTIFRDPGPKPRMHHPCEQINPYTGEVIATHESAVRASSATGIKRGTILKCLSGGNATAGGFAWRYKD